MTALLDPWVVLLVCSATLGAGTVLFRRAAGTLSPLRLNVVSWTFYYPILLQSFVGITLAVLGVEHYMMAKGDESAIVKAFFTVCYVVIAMPLAMVFVQRVILRRPMRERVMAYFSAPLRPLQTRRDSALVYYFVALSFVATLAMLYTYSYMSRPPMLALLQGASPLEFGRLRQEVHRGFGGSVHVRNLLGTMLAPMMAYVAYGYLKLYRTLPYRIWFYGMAAVAVLMVTYNGAKAPILALLVILFFLKSIIEGGASKRLLAVMFLGMVALIAAFYVLILGELNLELTKGPIGRVLLTQIAALPLSFDYFPAKHDFLMGASFPDWMTSFFGIDHVRSSRLIMEHYNRYGVEQGTAGVMNTLFVGEAWSNFGLVGLLVSPLLVGGLIQLLHHVLISLPKTPATVALTGYFMYELPITGGFVDFLWNVSWILILILFGTMVAVRPFLLTAAESVRPRPPTGAAARGGGA